MTIPIVIVTGFLGAGKTTLVNRLLARRAARGDTSKIGVIVNELGEVGIDGALLGGDAARQVELPGGCVCCVLGDELDRTLLELAERAPDLEAIVLETTGVAEPLGIAWALGRPPVAEHFRLAAVATLVDATTFRASRSLSAAVDAQVAYADVVLVTKAELAGDADAGAAEAIVRELAPRAEIRRGSPDDHAAWLERALADPELSHDDDGAPHVHDEHCDHAPGHAHGVDSVWAAIDGVVDLEELEDRLAELPASYVRIKGIARAIDGRNSLPAGSAAEGRRGSIDGRDGEREPRWVAVHRVGLRVSSEPLARPSEHGRLVALGTGLDAGMLERCIAASLLPR